MNLIRISSLESKLAWSPIVSHTHTLVSSWSQTSTPKSYTNAEKKYQHFKPEPTTCMKWMEKRRHNYKVN
jgi:hypothetical protein